MQYVTQDGFRTSAARIARPLWRCGVFSCLRYSATEEALGRLLATGNTAEVFERGSRVMKLLEITRGTIRSIARGGDGRSCGGSRVWNVRDIGGRWGLVFDRVAQTSFAEHMLGKMKDVCRYLECMVQLHTPIHGYQQSNLRGSRSHLQPTLQRACISTSRASENATTQSWICRTATNYVTVTSTR